MKIVTDHRLHTRSQVFQMKMYAILSTIISVILFYCTPLIAEDSADCFKQQGKKYTRPSDGASRISAGLACPESTKTYPPLAWGGFVYANSTLNVTTSDASMVYNAVTQATGLKFAEFIYGSVGNGTYYVQPGQIGFMDFTGYNLCYTGILENCISDISNDTLVEACQPEVLSGDDILDVPTLDGTSSFVTTTPDNIVGKTTNPAANETKPSSDVISMAVKLEECKIWSLTIMIVVGLVGWYFF